jgi:hypothetical protein
VSRWKRSFVCSRRRSWRWCNPSKGRRNPPSTRRPGCDRSTKRPCNDSWQRCLLIWKNKKVQTTTPTLCSSGKTRKQLTWNC